MVNVGCINKHTSLLPSFKGLFPFIWAYIEAKKQGMTFHLLTERFDDGPILAQKVIPQKHSESMISFYKTVFNEYPRMLNSALKNLRSGKISEQSTKNSYYSLPTKQDIKRFKLAGGRIISFRDLL